jgi:predicted GTPase
MELFKQIVSQRVVQYYIFLTLMLVAPLMTLIGMGYFYLWTKNWLLWFSLGLLVLALTAMLLRYLLMLDQRQQMNQPAVKPEFIHLEPIANWSTADAQIWKASLANLERMGVVNVEWNDLLDAMMDQIAFVAGHYHQGASNVKYAFTLPELLLMMEVFGREYRGLVLENMPLSQSIKVSSLMGVSEKSTKLCKGYKKISPILDTLRAVLSAGVSVPAQVASKLGVGLGKKLTDHMQRNLKQLLFEHVSRIAINLYSGRLKLSDEELSLYRKSLLTAEEEAFRPLSVMVIGQVNAGKSSLVNALKEQSVAEVDVLPATAGFHHYHLLLTGNIDVTLMDSPGLDGNKGVTSAMLGEAAKADLLLWVSQANQPAKALDKDLLTEWDSYFKENLRRKKPPVLLVTTHNDMLKPQTSWQPPYDLNDTNNKKVQSIIAASRYTRDALELPEGTPVVPIALKPGEAPYNIDALRDVLIELSAEARAAQLNRERLDAAGTLAAVTKTLSQTASLASNGVKLIFR